MFFSIFLIDNMHDSAKMSNDRLFPGKISHCVSTFATKMRMFLYSDLFSVVSQYGLSLPTISPTTFSKGNSSLNLILRRKPFQ